MSDFLFCEQLILACEPFDDIDIESVFHDKTAFPRCCRIFSLFVNRLKNRRSVLHAAVIVIFTESRRGMNDSRTVCRRNIIHTGDKKSFVLRNVCPRHQLFITDAFQVFPLHLFKNFIGILAEHLIREFLCHVEDVSFLIALQHLCFDIIDFRSYREECVRCQRPGRRRPREEILVFFYFYFKLYGQCVDLNFFIPLRDFM